MFTITASNEKDVDVEEEGGIVVSSLGTYPRSVWVRVTV